jgi:hypothetical protein
MYQLQQWQICHWRKGFRYYSCQIKQDLFGTWVFTRVNGGAKSKRGREVHFACRNFQEASELLEAAKLIRHKRKYHLISYND